MFEASPVSAVNMVIFIMITCLLNIFQAPAVLAVTVEQIVAPNSVTTVRLPNIRLGDRSGVRIVARQHQSEQNILIDGGSRESNTNNSSDHSIKDIVYFSTNFEGNLNTWSMNVNSKKNSSKSLCYNPVHPKVKQPG